MRLRPASLAASVKLSNSRVTPGRVTLDVEKATSPKKSVSTSAAALLKVEWPETYSGWFGVVRSGDQFGSAVVASLPSVSASWMAVTGRHEPYVYFASHAAMAESASATLSSVSR